jgi:hypothetical protein
MAQEDCRFGNGRHAGTFRLRLSPPRWGVRREGTFRPRSSFEALEAGLPALGLVGKG